MMDVEQKIILTLYVPSIEGTVAWYERVLGWRGHFDTFDEEGRCVFGSVMKRDTLALSLNLSRSEMDEEGEVCRHCSIWVYVADVDAVYQRVLVQGWPVESEITNMFWGERQFRLRDITGNELVFVQPIEELKLEEIRARYRAISKKD